MTAALDDIGSSYDALAPVYDVLTAGHDHAAWAAEVEELAIRAGLAGRRLLDVACGTGNLTAPMTARGYAATGVDVSPAMLALAREKLGRDVPLHHADMRALPTLGAFDLVWSLGDAVNYLLEEAALVDTFEGMARNLAPGGIVAFDANTLATFRTVYSSLVVVPGAESVVVHDGQGRGTIEAGATVEAWIDRLERAGPQGWARVRIVHRQRHHPPPVVLRALGAAGLEHVAVWGTDGAGDLRQPLDEDRHSKAVYIAHRGAPTGGRG